MWLGNIISGRSRSENESIHNISTDVRRYVQIGRLWVNDDSCFLRLTGWRQGPFAVKPGFEWRNLIHGDLIAYGTYGQDMKRVEQWCGFITTQENEKGTIYVGYMDVSPWPLLWCKRWAEPDNKDYRFGITLQVKE